MYIWSLSKPLIRFPGVQRPWTVRDAIEHTQIFGSPGSGKTSGSGYHIASSFLRSGFGGLVLAAKTSEVGLWKSLAEEHGRQDDLVIMDGSGNVPFNFMEYELNRGGAGGGDPGGIVDLFFEINRIRDSSGPQGGGGENEQFFKDNTGRLIRAAITIAIHATGSASLPLIEDLIQDSPVHPEDATDPTWMKNSLLGQAIEYIRDAKYAYLSPTDQTNFDRAEAYWLKSWPKLPDRTRESIRATYQGISDQFLDGRYRKLFCSDTKIVPEVTHHGAIILLNFPPSEHGVFGRIAQVLFKHIWQQATLRRIPNTGGTDPHMRPVFLWADESQNFITSLDSRFLNEAREARAAVVYLTQGLPNYDAEIGRDRTRAMLNSLGTKLFHALGDSDTIDYATKLVGQQTIFRESIKPRAYTPDGQQSFDPDISYSEQLDNIINNGDFYRMAKGDGVDGLVEALLVKSGRTWPPDDMPCYLWKMIRRGV